MINNVNEQLRGMSFRILCVWGGILAY